MILTGKEKTKDKANLKGKRVSSVRKASNALTAKEIEEENKNLGITQQMTLSARQVARDAGYRMITAIYFIEKD